MNNQKFENFVKNLKSLTMPLRDLKWKDCVFPAVMGYCLFFLVYNFAILQYSWSQGVIVQKSYFDRLLLVELSPLLFVGILSFRVLANNLFSEKVSKIVDLSVYALLCFSVGYIYATFNTKSSGGEYTATYYILSIIFSNVLLTIAKEYNVKLLLAFFCTKPKSTFFKLN